MGNDRKEIQTLFSLKILINIQYQNSKFLQIMNSRKAKSLVAISAAIALTGCASTYGNLVSGSNLGAMEYQPAVLKKPGMEGKYNEILQVCRQVAVNRQITAAQEAQLKTITGVSSSSLQGASFGLQMGSIFKQAGYDTSMTRQAGIGLLAGSLTGLAGSFASGTENNAAETKRVLLSCLQAADPKQEYYKVLG